VEPFPILLSSGLRDPGQGVVSRELTCGAQSRPHWAWAASSYCLSHGKLSSSWGRGHLLPSQAPLPTTASSEARHEMRHV